MKGTVPSGEARKLCLFLNESCCARCPFFSCHNNPYFNLALEIARASLRPHPFAGEEGEMTGPSAPGTS
jgi:hypothetical protein